MDMGVVAEGVVELDPMTGRLVLRCEGPDGIKYVDVQEVLERYKGEEVRFIVAPFSTIDRLASLVESGAIEMAEVPPAGSKPV